MSTIKKPFTLPLPVKLAWLLRSDVRGDEAIDDSEAQKNFLTWWVLIGAKEYNRPLELDEAAKYVLFEPLPDTTNHLPFGMSRVAQRLASIRTDIAMPTDSSKTQELLQWHSWFFICGLREHSLLHLVDKITLQRLNQTAALLPAATDPAKTNNTQITWLMFFAWQSRQDLQEAFDLTTALGCEKLMRWFWTGGCVELGLMPLITEEYRQWLCTLITIGTQQTKIPYVAYLLWQARDDIRAIFDLSSLIDQQQFEAWIINALKEEPALSWLAQDILQKRQSAKIVRKGVNLIGFAYGELGIGEDVRMAAAACDAAGIAYDVISIEPGDEVRQADYSVAEKVKDKGTYPVNIFCLTGFDTAHLWLKRADELFAGHYNIGWWPWELPVWPKHWRCVFDFVDEIWAATEFTYNMYREATDKPVHRVPLPVRLPDIPLSKRKKFALPEDKFLYLYIFDFNSYLARKNPWAAVEAFCKAFPKRDKSVGLVLKTMNSRENNPLWNEFRGRCAKDERIILIEQTLDRVDVMALLAACDVYVSLHRSEGFGRTLAEAMLLGKPVVATNFSGNTDFLTTITGFPVRWQKIPVNPGDYPFISEEDEAYWAEPEMADAVRQLKAARQAAADPEFAGQVRAFAEEQFSVDRIGAIIKKQLSRHL